MIKIKISADNERLLQRAKTEGELRGAVDLILERIGQAKAEKAFEKPTAQSEGSSPYYWKTVVAGLREVLGDDVRVPPYPDRIWIASTSRFAKMYGLEGEALTKLATAVKESTLKPPYDVRFLLQNCERILAGTYSGDGKYTDRPKRGSYKRGAPLPSLPEN